MDPGVDPWQQAPQLTGPDIDEVGIDPDEVLPDEVTISVDAPVVTSSHSGIKNEVY